MRNTKFILCAIILLAPALVFGQKETPKTVRDFYFAMPTKYLKFEQCEEKTDKNCEKYRRQYLKDHLDVEDNENGYLEINGENLDPDIAITLFKRADNSYLIGVTTGDTISDECHFLSYEKGKWKEVSKKVVPEFDNKTKSYGLPREGTTVEVVSRNAEDGFSYYGEKLYDLEWTGAKFVIKK